MEDAKVASIKHQGEVEVATAQAEVMRTQLDDLKASAAQVQAQLDASKATTSDLQDKLQAAEKLIGQLQKTPAKS